MTIEQQHDGAVATQNAAATALMGGAGMTATGRAEVAAAVAQVLAKIQVARTFKRDMEMARDQVLDSCRRWSFAKKAFYTYPRGKRQLESGEWVDNYITGPSVHLARELARAFQHLDDGLVEVDRDEERHIAVMRAFCRDNQLNSETSTTFIIAHVRDKWEGPKGHRVKVKEPLFDERDVYERNANDGARRLRAMIFGMLPAWYLDEAVEQCNRTLAQGEPDANGEVKPLPVRMANAVDAFAAAFGIRKDQLEQYAGAPFADWRVHDLARLIVLYESLTRGEVRKDDVFPPPAASPDDVAAQAGATAPPAPAAEPGGPPLMSGTRLEIDRLFKELGLGGKANIDRRLAIAGVLAVREGEPPVVPGRWKDLDNDQGKTVQAGLRRLLGESPAGREAELARLEELAAQAPPPGAAAAGGGGTGGGEPEAPDAALMILRGRFEDAGRGGGEHRDLMLAVTSVLVFGHYAELGDLGELTPEQAAYAVTQFDSVAASAARRDKTTADGLDLMYQAAVRQRGAGDQDGGGADEPGEE